ncbi:MAG TPA: S8 family serine peptidase, partial [Acidimicrobiales bacterium]|nr:S8 family serine peptidase [Acidimicrobiales bacterium]
GWNFVDNTNDPYDDVLYGHGTGEASDATGAADSSGEVGSCPDCMVMPLRVGESFIADSNDFARAVLFAVDGGASVLQEALGTLDVTTPAAQAIAYANAYGVPVISSAADEEAEHHNEPGNLPGTIVVNSVSQAPSQGGQQLYRPGSYLYLNGCTNYGGNVGVSVESASCSSEATGKTGGITGLIESQARNLLGDGRLAPYPGIRSAAGTPVALSTTEVRELIEMSADDVDFQSPVVPGPTALAGTNPEPPDNYGVVSPYPTTRYPTQPGYDMYTGYGRIDAANILSWLSAGRIPPEASFGEMQWFQTYNPAQTTLPVPVDAAAVRTPGAFHWQLQYGIGTQPEPRAFTDVASGTGKGGSTGAPIETVVHLSPAVLEQIAAQLPSPATNHGPDQPAFTLRLVVTDAHGLVGEDRRTEYLVRDASLLSGDPVQPAAAGAGTDPVTQPATSFGGSVDAAPTLAPIGPGGSDALIVATADGTVHAYVPHGGVGLRDLPGWPVQTELLPGQAAISASEPAYRRGKVTAVPHCTIVGGVAVGRLVAGGAPDVVASDWCGYVYAWTAGGQLLPGFPVHTNRAFSQDPAPYAGTASGTDPAVDPRDPNNRLLPGIVGAPSLADLTGSGGTDVVVSSLDRHIYAWDSAGRMLRGYPVLVVDPAQVQSVDVVTNHVVFKPSVDVQMGSMILDTPAIGNLAGKSGPPDLVVGTDEEYGCNPATVPGAGLQEKSGLPPCAISVKNAVNWGLGAAGASLLNPANSRVYALRAGGTRGSANCSGGSAQPDACAILPGWPVPLVDLDAGLLPDVADGTTASPALADLAGNGQLEVGDITSVGPGYIYKPNGQSYFGNGPDGQPVSLSMAAAGPLANSRDLPSIPAVGMPVFAPLGPAAPGVSFVAPAASLGKALDAALPAEQYANDNQLDAWNTTTATMQPAFPQYMNDLQFIAQPIVADLNGPGQGSYVVEGSATSDIRAVGSDGREAAGFPKFTGDWIVNSPVFGPLGGTPDQVLAAGTREGDLFVWSTPTPSCQSSGPWPRQHHDLSNSNDLDFTAAVKPSCAG